MKKKKTRKKKKLTEQEETLKAVREANKLGGWGPYLYKHNKGFRDEYDRLQKYPICEKCLMVHGDEGCYWNADNYFAKKIREDRKRKGLPI